MAKDDFLFGEIKGYFHELGRYCSSADNPATVVLVADNPYEKTVRISGFIDSHPFIETVTIREGDPKIYFDLKIDWKSSPGIGGYRQKDGWHSPERIPSARPFPAAPVCHTDAGLGWPCRFRPVLQ